jgi:hypothetical protein
VEAQQRVAKNYFEDGCYEKAVPPLQAVLAVMAHGSWNGKTLDDPDVRAMFSRETMLQSDWYRARLDAKRQADINLWERHKQYLTDYCSRDTHTDVAERMDLFERIKQAEGRLEFFKTDEYLDRIEGTLGTDPGLVHQPSNPAKAMSASAS